MLHIQENHGLLNQKAPSEDDDLKESRMYLIRYRRDLSLARTCTFVCISIIRESGLFDFSDGLCSKVSLQSVR